MLYFIRHGQTDDNINHILTGRQNIELNEKGITQAKQEAINCKNLNIDIIFCSPLKRAIDTCNFINEYHNAPVIISEEIIERSYGEYENMNASNIDRERCWNYYIEDDMGNVETPKMVLDRVYAFLNKIKENYIDKDVLIVAHNGIGRAIHCYFNGIPSDGGLLDLGVPNAKILKYDWR